MAAYAQRLDNSFKERSAKPHERLKRAEAGVDARLKAREYQAVLYHAYNGSREPGESVVNVNKMRKQDPETFTQQALAFDAYKQFVAAGLVEGGTPQKAAWDHVHEMIAANPWGVIDAATQWNAAQQQSELQPTSHS